MVKKKRATGGDEYEAYITQSPTDIEGSVLEWCVDGGYTGLNHVCG